MNWFKSFVTAFCTAGICFGALFIICPSGKMERSVKYVLSLCFLVIIVAVAGVGIKNANIEFEFDTDTIIETENLDNATAKYVFAEVLRDAKINFKEILTFTDNDGKNGISCTKVKIVTDCSKERVINALVGEIEGIEVEVVNE